MGVRDVGQTEDQEEAIGGCQRVRGKCQGEGPQVRLRYRLRLRENGRRWGQLLGLIEHLCRCPGCDRRFSRSSAQKVLPRLCCAFGLGLLALVARAGGRSKQISAIALESLLSLRRSKRSPVGTAFTRVILGHPGPEAERKAVGQVKSLGRHHV